MVCALENEALGANGVVNVFLLDYESLQKGKELAARAQRIAVCEQIKNLAENACVVYTRIHKTHLFFCFKFS